MHTYTSKNNTTFHYSSDFSGDVYIITHVKLPGCEDHPDQQIEVSGEAILEFVAFCHIQVEKISRIEEMSKEELLLRD